jgi:hypothetical protein
MALGQSHQAALVADEALVDVVELLDQRVDARLIEPQRLHLADDLIFELLVAAFLRGRERIVAQLVLDVLVLQAAQPFVGVGNLVEGLDHLGLAVPMSDVLNVIQVPRESLDERRSEWKADTTRTPARKPCYRL